MTRLIINGDDFGATSSINRAVVRAFRRGILTSCSLMVGGQGFHEAARMARDIEGLAVGLHLVAVMGKSVLPPDRLPTLVDRQGRFRTDPVSSGLLCFFSRRARRELGHELRAQFERFLSTGLGMSHVDSHLHFHLHPVIFRMTVELCGEYGIRGMRVPEDDPGLLSSFRGGTSFQQRSMSRLFRIFTRRMKARLSAEGIVYPRRVFGHLMTGCMDRGYVLHLLDHLPEGDFEIYFHPGESEGDSALAAQRHRELEILLDPDVKGRIADRGIHLIHYGHLARAS